MLYNYFIFLCIGVYASYGKSSLRTEIYKIQKDFCKIEQKLGDHLTQGEEAPQHIPDNFSKTCANFHLNTFISLLDQLSVTKETPYSSFLHHLKRLAKYWPEQNGDDPSCQNTFISNRNFHSKLAKFLLEALPTFVNGTRTTCPPK